MLGKANIGIANLCPIMIHFDALDFSECSSEEVTFSVNGVTAALVAYFYVGALQQHSLLNINIISFRILIAANENWQLVR